MDFAGLLKKKGKYPKPFIKWVGSNYGPPDSISESDLQGLFEEWDEKQKSLRNSLAHGEMRGNALAN